MKPLRPVLLLFVLPALFLWAARESNAYLWYDRAAIAHGQWWRLWTGHWVHFSWSHLAWNLAVLMTVGAWLECIRPGSLIRCTFVTAPLISLALLLGDPGLQVYGGLSGLAVHVLVLLALHQIQRQPRQTLGWIAVLSLVAFKIACESALPFALFSRFENRDIHVSLLAHFAGAALAVVIFLVTSARHPKPAYA